LLSAPGALYLIHGLGGTAVRVAAQIKKLHDAYAEWSEGER
jgi:hypothetical protein